MRGRFSVYREPSPVSLFLSFPQIFPQLPLLMADVSPGLPFGNAGFMPHRAAVFDALAPWGEVVVLEK